MCMVLRNIVHFFINYYVNIYYICINIQHKYIMEKEIIRLFNNIKEIVFNYFNSNSDTLYKNQHSKASNDAKMYLYYILHYGYNISVPKIAKLARKTERNIKYSVSNMKYRIGNIEEFSCTYNILIDIIGNPSNLINKE